MSYFEDASLVLIPSAQKLSKIYSVKPTDGTGDLTFTRSNDTATRVGPDGLIEKVRTNLILQSETFSNASWVKDGATFSGDTLTAGAGTAFKGVYQVQTTQGVQVNYFDVAYVDHQWLQILVGTSGSDLGYANFDIQNKVVGSFSGIISATIQDFGTYVRLVYAINTTNKTATNIIFVDSGSAGRAASTSSTGSFKLLRAQVETGDIATDYIATTTAAVSVGPVANVPRLDYLNSSCPRLLLEPQRTNLLQYNEQFDNAYWTKLNSTITANAAVSPDGYSNADQITDDATSGSHLVYRIPSARSTGTAWSIFMKKGTLNFGFIGNVQSSTAFTTAVIDLTNGTVKELQNGSGNTGSVTVQDYGNGWYRVIMQSSANGGGTSIGTSDGSALSGSTKDAIYSGTGKHIFVWGAQLEDAAYATSYIPTLGAAVTRGADACSKTGISSLIGQTEGTLFVDFIYEPKLAAGETTYRVSLSDGTYSNRGTLIVDVSSNTMYVVCGGVNTSSTPVSLTIGQRYKMAFSYKTNDFAFYVNGSQNIHITSGASVPASLTQFQFSDAANIATRTFAGPISQTLIFKTRLSNDSLAALTA